MASKPSLTFRKNDCIASGRMIDKKGNEIPVPTEAEWVAKDLAAAGGNYNKVREGLIEHGKTWPWPAEMGLRRLAEWEKAEIVPQAQGSLYTADLPDEMIDRMLDWDKPISEQSPSVLAALEKSKNKQIRAMLEYAKTPYISAGIRNETKTMGEAYQTMSMNLTGRANSESVKASKLIQEAGIPGIKYLDAGSRGDKAKPTRNFVIFPGEEKKVKILKRE